MRIGHGYDAHKLVEDRPLILGGINIPYKMGLLGHSDADVLCHALSDALLGSLALGTIGQHFPDNDPKYKNANSLNLLSEVYSLIKKKNYQLVNADITLIAQAPKLMPFIPKIQEAIAKALSVHPSQISIKATTEEGMGFSGREEGMSCHAVCLVKKQDLKPDIRKI